MNTIILSGYIANDITNTKTNAGKSKSRFNLAVKRKNAQEGYQTTDFIPIECYNKTADNVYKHCKKGSRILIEQGELRINQSEENGNMKYYTSVVAHYIEFLSKVESEKNQNDITDPGIKNDSQIIVEETINQPEIDPAQILRAKSNLQNQVNDEMEFDVVDTDFFKDFTSE